jgi:hypothetical protein
VLLAERVERGRRELRVELVKQAEVVSAESVASAGIRDILELAASAEYLASLDLAG